MYIENVNPIQPELMGLEPRISKIMENLLENYDLLQGYTVADYRLQAIYSPITGKNFVTECIAFDLWNITVILLKSVILIVDYLYILISGY